MSRLANNASLALAALTLTALATTADAGCGGKGGGHRTSGRLSIAYNRSAPHMRSHAPQGSGHHNNYHHARRHQPVRQHVDPVYQPQPVVSQPIPAFQPAPVAQPIVAPQPVAQPQPAPAPVAPQPAATAEQAAIDALAAFTAAPAAVAPSHVGSWNATIASSQVNLTLNADGTFRWTANAAGKTSSFEGTYTMSNGQLTLIRTDSQTLAGAWTTDAAGGFRFQLAGTSDSGLVFARS